MATSYNGWPAYPDITSRTVPLVINGVPFVGGIVDNADAITVFTYIFTRFDAEVERLVSPGCWGASFRQNRNANNISCHGSATAADANAPKHPNGIEASQNFTPKQIATIHEILTSVPELDEVIHWGGDWHRANGLTPDPMHFELHDHDLSKLHRVAQRIRALSTPARPSAGTKVEEAIKDLKAAKARPGTVRASVLDEVLKALRGLRRRA